MKKVFEGVNPATQLEVTAKDSALRFTAYSSDGYGITVTLPNATGTELALAVLEAMDSPGDSPETVAEGLLREALEARQRDQKLEALALELCNTYRAASEMKQLSSFEGYATLRAHWVPVAAKALELGASK